MLLCIDCGNTRLKWGLRDGSEWRERGVLPLTGIERLKPELERLPLPSRAIACGVAGEQACKTVEKTLHDLGLPFAWAVSRPEQCGVKNAYDDPAQLGADRWAALIGAHHMHGGACLVVNAGTATTIDVLDAAGVFQGGLILPGIDLMRASLASNTARLPLTAGDYRPCPRNTADAIASGALQATAGAITRMFAHVAGAAGAKCLLTGGAAAALLPVLEVPLCSVDNLVLEGLVRIAGENR